MSAAPHPYLEELIAWSTPDATKRESHAPVSLAKVSGQTPANPATAVRTDIRERKAVMVCRGWEPGESEGAVMGFVGNDGIPPSVHSLFVASSEVGGKEEDSDAASVRDLPAAI